MASTMRFDKWENPTGTLSLDITQATPGLVPIIPTSVAVTSGSASIAGNGLITFSGTADVRIEGVFSSAYTNYRVEVNSTGASANMALAMRMRVGGADYTTGNQAVGTVYWGYPGTISVTGATTQTDLQAGWVNGSADSKNFAVITIANPNVAAFTSYHAQSTSYVSSISNGYVPTTTQYTGLTITSSSTPTFGGTIRIYGLK